MRRKSSPHRAPGGERRVRDEATGVSEILPRARRGEPEAHAALFEALYRDLRRVARGAMRREAPGQTLEPTALVHEVFLKLAHGPVPWADRRHFFAVAARAMRQVLIDHARSRRSRRRRETPDKPVAAVLVEYETRAIDILALDDALQQLEAADARAARVVELRFFGGQTLPHVARTIGVPLRTVERDWAWARAFLYARLS